MYLNLVGINHHITPVNIRERAAVRRSRVQDALEALKKTAAHCVILSTCNRTEIYTVENHNQEKERAGLFFLKKYLHVPESILSEYAYFCSGAAAAEHLFGVAGGLDSMIVGECEVLGQVKRALASAEEAGTANLPLRRLFQASIRTGRRIRKETEISRNHLSVSSIAVELAVQSLGDLARCRILIIGAGEAGKGAVLAAREKNAGDILVASRTLERASALARVLRGTAIKFDDIPAILGSCDLVVACADAGGTIINSHQVAQALQKRNGSPQVIIDIAVPRNVDPDAGLIDNVSLYNIDDLNLISEKNHQLRKRELIKARRIIREERERFLSWWRSFSVSPVIFALMEKANRIRDAYFDKTLKKLPTLSDEERHSLEKMTEVIVTRLLQDTVDMLKENSNRDGQYSRLVSQLFRLDCEVSQ
ncbi:MAG: glutamyl-tRNA reductase [Chloroflexi bacterium RBG_16_56_11]|nr:MAG: glutamyl-tRNA reductase [Chloroflexi bacterium RBG_16_56_11]